MYQVILHPKAIVEFDDVYEWYGKESNELGKRFRRRSYLSLIQFKITLKCFKPKRGGTEAVLDVFLHAIVYILNKKLNTIKISAIYHTSRHPRKKYRR